MSHARTQHRSTAAETAGQGEFDFLMPFSDRRTLLRPQEVAICIGRSEDFVYAEVECGRLEAHGPLGRVRTRLMITRRSVLVWLAETALYEPGYVFERIEKVIHSMTRPDIERVIRTATLLLTRV